MTCFKQLTTASILSSASLRPGLLSPTASQELKDKMVTLDGELLVLSQKERESTFHPLEEQWTPEQELTQSFERTRGLVLNEAFILLHRPTAFPSIVFYSKRLCGITPKSSHQPAQQPANEPAVAAIPFGISSTELHPSAASLDTSSPPSLSHTLSTEPQSYMSLDRAIRSALHGSDAYNAGTMGSSAGLERSRTNAHLEFVLNPVPPLVQPRSNCYPSDSVLSAPLSSADGEVSYHMPCYHNSARSPNSVSLLTTTPTTTNNKPAPYQGHVSSSTLFNGYALPNLSTEYLPNATDGFLPNLISTSSPCDFADFNQFSVPTSLSSAASARGENSSQRFWHQSSSSIYVPSSGSPLSLCASIADGDQQPESVRLSVDHPVPPVRPGISSPYSSQHRSCSDADQSPLSATFIANQPKLYASPIPTTACLSTSTSSKILTPFTSQLSIERCYLAAISISDISVQQMSDYNRVLGRKPRAHPFCACAFFSFFFLSFSFRLPPLPSSTSRCLQCKH